MRWDMPSLNKIKKKKKQDKTRWDRPSLKRIHIAEEWNESDIDHSLKCKKKNANCMPALKAIKHIYLILILNIDMNLIVFYSYSVYYYYTTAVLLF